MLVSKFDVDDVGAGLSGAVGDFARAVLHVLTVDVYFARAFDTQSQAPITWQETKDASPSGPATLLSPPHMTGSVWNRRPACIITTSKKG